MGLVDRGDLCLEGPCTLTVGHGSHTAYPVLDNHGPILDLAHGRICSRGHGRFECPMGIEGREMLRLSWVRVKTLSTSVRPSRALLI